MRIQRAKAHLSNGEVVDIKLLTKDIWNWIDGVSVNGIKTKDKYIPHHSITYILIEQPEENDDEFEVEFEAEPIGGADEGVLKDEGYF